MTPTNHPQVQNSVKEEMLASMAMESVPGNSPSLTVWLLLFSSFGGALGTAFLGAPVIMFQGPLATLEIALKGYLVIGVPFALITGIIYRLLMKRLNVQCIGKGMWWLACLLSSSWFPFSFVVAFLITQPKKIADYFFDFGVWILFLAACTSLTAIFIHWLYGRNYVKAGSIVALPVGWVGTDLWRFLTQ